MISKGNGFELGLQNFQCECHKQRQWVNKKNLNVTSEKVSS